MKEAKPAGRGKSFWDYKDMYFLNHVLVSIQSLPAKPPGEQTEKIYVSLKWEGENTTWLIGIFLSLWRTQLWKNYNLKITTYDERFHASLSIPHVEWSSLGDRCSCGSSHRLLQHLWKSAHSILPPSFPKQYCRPILSVNPFLFVIFPKIHPIW